MKRVNLRTFATKRAGTEKQTRLRSGVKEERSVCLVCCSQEGEEEPTLENKERLYDTLEVKCVSESNIVSAS